MSFGAMLHFILSESNCGLYISPYFLLFLAQTDDKGVFCSDLSNEFLIAARTFSLNEQQLKNVSFDSINYCLAKPEEKDALRKCFQ